MIGRLAAELTCVSVLLHLSSNVLRSAQNLMSFSLRVALVAMFVVRTKVTVLSTWLVTL